MIWFLILANALSLALWDITDNEFFQTSSMVSVVLLIFYTILGGTII